MVKRTRPGVKLRAFSARRPTCSKAKKSSYSEPCIRDRWYPFLSLRQVLSFVIRMRGPSAARRLPAIRTPGEIQRVRRVLRVTRHLCQRVRRKSNPRYRVRRTVSRRHVATVFAGQTFRRRRIRRRSCAHEFEMLSIFTTDTGSLSWGKGGKTFSARESKALPEENTRYLAK